MRITTLLGIIILLCSCNLISNDGFSLHTGIIQHDPLPQWITQVETQVTTSTWVTVHIDEAYVWLPNDGRGELAEQFARTLTFYLDGQEVEDYKILQDSPFGMPVEVYDEHGNVIGTYGEHRTASFMAPNRAGEHLVTLEVTRTNGEVLSYTWQLSISEE